MTEITNPHYATMPQRFTQFRRHLGLSQAEMAKMLDITQSSVSAIELAKYDVTVRIAYQLMEFDCSPNWLLFGEGPMSYAQATQNKATVEVRQLPNHTEYVVRVRT